MALPKFEDFLYPFLLQLKEKSVTKKEMKELLAKYLNLTEEDCNTRTKGGNTTQFNDRITWSLQYLRRALFVDIPQRGMYQITERGKKHLNKHDGLTIADLLQYPEFAEYYGTPVSTKKQTSSTTPTETKEELTPAELLDNAYKDINDKLADDLLEMVLEQHPKFFERLVLDLLLKMGYGDPTDESAKVTPYGHDDGVDGIIPQDKLGLDKIYFQAKRYRRDIKVGKPQIQTFAGALDEQKANKGVFITTSSYSKEARNFIDRTTKKIVLIDGAKLARYMIEHNVGVSTQRVYEVKKIDTDYFEDLQ